MLGMSIGKLLVLALIIAAVWYGFKWLGSRGQRRVAGRGKESARPGVETELIPCAVCGTYVPRGSEHCGQIQGGRGDGAA